MAESPEQVEPSPVEPASPEPVEPAPELDEVLAAQVALARAALEEITPIETIGAHLGARAEADRVASLLFASLLPGYPGWQWTVTLARVDDAPPTVLEVELLPGEGALLAPEWVPWSVRLAEYQAAKAAGALSEDELLPEDAAATEDPLDEDDDLDEEHDQDDDLDLDDALDEDDAPDEDDVLDLDEDQDDDLDLDEDDLPEIDPVLDELVDGFDAEATEPLR